MHIERSFYWTMDLLHCHFVVFEGRYSISSDEWQKILDLKFPHNGTDLPWYFLLCRLENSPSALDLVKDMQDTERISLVNRLAVHHTPLYSPHNLDSPIRAVPQKAATPVQMPSKLPEGLLCVSL